MILDKGEIVFIITRRLFENDLRRHFVGEVLESSDSVVRTRGYTFVFDDSTNEFSRRVDARTRIFSLTDSGFIINILASGINLEDIQYKVDERKHTGKKLHTPVLWS